MKACQIKLFSIQDIREFVEIVTKFEFEIDLSCGRYVVDAKSIMGIFSLDLSKPIELNIHTDDAEKFLADIDKFIVK